MKQDREQTTFARKFLITSALLLLAIGYSWSKELVDARLKAVGEVADIRYLPSPALAKVLAIGYEPAVADIYWIEGINYYGSELLNPHRNYKYLSEYCDLIAALDPYFSSFYNWAGTAFIYTALDITRDSIVSSTRYVNLGIRNLAKINRYDRELLLKGAFNYALEAHIYKPSISYFETDARSFRDQRTMFLVASSYAARSEDADPTLAANLREEFLGNVAFEAQTKDELQYAINVMSSSNLNSRAAEFVRTLRLQMESDENVRKLVEKRLKENPILQEAMLQKNDPFADPRLANALSVDLNRTWMPAEMLVLLSL